MFVRKRHRVTVRAENHPPLGFDMSEPALDPALVQSGGIVLLDPVSADDPETIEEFAAADFDGEELQPSVWLGPSRPVAPRMQLWGPDTIGVPRQGSRTVRLFQTEPARIAAGVRTAAVTDQLSLGGYEQRVVLGEPELHGSGSLSGSFLLRRSASVEVTVRVARFNSLFSALELKLVSRGHPRRFFVAAHDAIDALDLPEAVIVPLRRRPALVR